MMVGAVMRLKMLVSELRKRRGPDKEQGVWELHFAASYKASLGNMVNISVALV